MRLIDTGLPAQLAHEILPTPIKREMLERFTQRMEFDWSKGEIPTTKAVISYPRINIHKGSNFEEKIHLRHITLGDAAKWAYENGFPVRPELRELLNLDTSQSPPPGSGDNAGDDEEIDPRQRKTYLQVIGALLKDGYGMDIHAKKVEGVTDLLDYLNNQGAKISERTLRDIIKAAAELLPPIEKKSKS